jgi:uncharacterized circularly permuted ATP-grasp superfamily protein
MSIDWKYYPIAGQFDELIDDAGRPRPSAAQLCRYLDSLSDNELAERESALELAIKTLGITFTVYTEQGNIDRAWPVDLLPRIISADEWENTEQGLRQRAFALNLFIDDLYNDQRIIKDKIIPYSIIGTHLLEECTGVKPPWGKWSHICGSDIVRANDGQFYVLEDNLRIPSGVSYMLENRLVIKRIFPELFENYFIQPVDEYPSELFDMLSSLTPRPGEEPSIVVLTPGIYNSAYFEHAYLAQQMGVDLVEGKDLYVGADDHVYKQTIQGARLVDVIYRRVDDAFLDPEIFRDDSILGTPGLMRAWRKGNVALANAPGTAVADDKVVYAFVPKIIKYYLDEEPLLPNVETYLCLNKKERKHVLANLEQLVVKPANEAGGYGIMIGPQASKKEREEYAETIRKNPRNYIAQPTLSLSTVPTYCDDRIEPRHIDLRPFILSGERTYVTKGGLTRVARKKGSLIVNSSQGGGSKDTWIVQLEDN